MDVSVTMNIGTENETIEFKKSTSELKQGLISIASILNKHGKGTLYFGVKDNGDVVGQQLGKDTLKDISFAIRTNVSPALLFTVEQRQTLDGKPFIEISFSGERTPYSAFGRYYLRFHDEDTIMDNEVLRQYILSSRRHFSDWENRKSSCRIEDVDDNELSDYAERGIEKKRIRLSSRKPEVILGKLGLLYDDRYLNNAGNVLFSKNRPVRLKLAKFASDSRATILDMDNFDGNIFECIRRGEDYYASNINWRVERTGSTRHTEIPEIPLVAIHEILVNAFSHGDYDNCSDFELDIYSDRVCIYSPGFFPKPYTPEDFAQKGIEPIPLNVKISSVLYKDGTIEQISSGFERTFAACRKYGIDYDYEDTGYGFRFTFYRGTKKTWKMSSTDRQIVEIMRRDPDITYSRIAAYANISSSTVLRSIRRLKQQNRIRREGSDKTGFWIVND